MSFLHAVLGSGPLFWPALVLTGMCLLANVYSVLGIFAACEFFGRHWPFVAGFSPPISILKPVRGVDPDSYRNLSSFFQQDYPDYELIFGMENEADAALPIVRQVLRDFPNVSAKIVFAPAPEEGSPKVASLACALAASRHALLLISDADIRVGPGHLRAMAQPMADPKMGVVTCLYRSEGRGFAGRLDAIGLTVEFQRDVLVARKVEGVSFAMGSGILIRRSVLSAIGGFPAVTNYLADDFLLGNLPRRLGYDVDFAHEVVDHGLATRSFAELVRHQLRWNRGIRVSRPGGYAGLVFTHAPALSVLLFALLGGSWFGAGVLAATMGLSIASAWLVAGCLLDDPLTRRALWMVPLRDLLSFLLWLGAMFGNRVDWRGRRFRLGRDGLLTPWTRASGIAAEPTSPQ